MKIIIDTREQAPFAFRHERMEATTEPGTLAVGDYSLAGLEDRLPWSARASPIWSCALAGNGRGSSGSLPGARRWMPSPWSVKAHGWN